MQTDAAGGGATEFDCPIVRRRQVARMPADTYVKQIVIVAPDTSAPQHGDAAEGATDSNSLDGILRRSRACHPSISYSTKLS